MSFIEAGDSLTDVIDCLQDDLASFLSLKTIRQTNHKDLTTGGSPQLHVYISNAGSYYVTLGKSGDSLMFSG